LYKAISKHTNPLKIYTDKLIDENSIDDAYAKNIIVKFKAMMEAEFAKSKEEKSSKVREFMQERWVDFKREKLEGMLMPTETLYPKNNLESIAKIISTVPKNVKFVRKAERILKGR